MTNLDSVLKSKNITLLTKVRIVKAMVFPVVMYRCGSWTIKKAEGQRIDAFELWCWRRLLRVPWNCKEIQPVHTEGDQPWDFFGGNFFISLKLNETKFLKLKKLNFFSFS